LESYDGHKYHYKVQARNKSAAFVSEQFDSTTLVPTAAELDEKTTLLDMVGFEVNRNYVEVMGVSYFIKYIFVKMKKVKFILVIRQMYKYHQNFPKLFQTILL